MIALWGVKSSQQIPDHVEPFCIQHQSAREDKGFIVVFPLVRKLQNRSGKLPAEVKTNKRRLKPLYVRGTIESLFDFRSNASAAG